MKKGLLSIFLIAGLLAAGSSPALSLSYFVYNQWGGTWHDANKTAANTEDDLMCWAAAASNVLAWGKWGTTTYNTTDKIFKEFQDHWTDNTGLPHIGMQWWFNGSSPAPSAYNSYVDVPGGGNFYPGLSFANYYVGFGRPVLSMVDLAMQYGYGSAILIERGGPVGHVITVWGFDYQVTKKGKTYNGIYVTDSDDGFYGLKYYPVTNKDNYWYLGGSYSGWLITASYNLKYNDRLSGAAVTPLPGSLCLVSGPLMLLGYALLFRRKS